jgi:galactonate dehydratase
MKITSVKTYPLSVPTGQEIRDPGTGELVCSTHKSWLFLKLETDAGISGWGDGSGEWLVGSVETMLQELVPLLLDRDPTQVEALTDDIELFSPWKGGPIIGTAIAAINMALYDIAGKAWGVPVHTILGGKRRDRLQVYASGGLVESSPSEAAATAQQHIANGYAGVKGNPLESRRTPMDLAAIDRSLECIAAVREAIGPDPAILLDTHGSPTPELSIEFSRRAAPYAPMFLEAPVKVGSVDALMDVTQRSPIPIATGEQLFAVREFEELILRRACAVLQPDITHCFGITAYCEIAKRANRQQMLMAPHNVAGPIGNAASFHASAATPNFLILEMVAPYFERFSSYAEHDWEIADGYINVSDRPGLGIEVKEADIAKIPHQPMAFRQYRHADGSWKGW